MIHHLEVAYVGVIAAEGVDNDARIKRFLYRTYTRLRIAPVKKRSRRFDSRCVHNVGSGQNNEVGVLKLHVRDAVILKIALEVLHIEQTDDCVEPYRSVQVGVQKSICDRDRIRQPGCLKDDVIDLRLSAQQRINCGEQVAPDNTAHAAVG